MCETLIKIRYKTTPLSTFTEVTINKKVSIVLENAIKMVKYLYNIVNLHLTQNRSETVLLNQLI